MILLSVRTVSKVLHLILLVHVFSLSSILEIASAESSRQEMIDALGDIIYSSEPTTNSPYIDIRTITISSQSDSLDATLWLEDSFSELHSSVTYGVLIDVDSDKTTGYGGFDYVIKRTWENGTWYSKIEEFTAGGRSRSISTTVLDFKIFDEDKKQVRMSVDLNEIGSPKKYDLVFFANEDISKDQSSVDYSPFIMVPPLEINARIDPSYIVMTPEQERKITVEIQSNSNLEQIMELGFDADSRISGIFQPNHFRMTDEEKIISLRINTNGGLTGGSHFIPIRMSSIFPPEANNPQYDLDNFIIKNAPQIVTNHQETTYVIVEITKPTDFEVTVKQIFTVGENIPPIFGAVFIPVIVFGAILFIRFIKNKYIIRIQSTESIERTKDES